MFYFNKCNIIKYRFIFLFFKKFIIIIFIWLWENKSEIERQTSKTLSSKIQNPTKMPIPKSPNRDSQNAKPIFGNPNPRFPKPKIQISGTWSVTTLWIKIKLDHRQNMKISATSPIYLYYNTEHHQIENLYSYYSIGLFFLISKNNIIFQFFSSNQKPFMS